MPRFLRGLNFNISSIVELYPYSDFDTLCELCLKLESQGKSKYGGAGKEYNKLGSGYENEFSSKSGSSNNGTITLPKTGSSPVLSYAPKTSFKSSDTHKETSLMKVRCFKCQGFGHYQNSCPNKRNIALREAISIRDELLIEEDKARGGLFV